MLYTRSSFIKWLQEKHDCKISPIGQSVIVITNGPVRSNMWMDGKNRIDYEEIFIHYQKLYLTSLPGEKDLERIE